MLAAADEAELVGALAAVDVAATITAVGLAVGAVAGAYATFVTARRAARAALPLPPPPASSDDEVLTARLWFELLSRSDAMATDLEDTRRRNLELERKVDAVEAERLELLRRLARGEQGA